jgi:transcriptional regulator with XRE-family HTH domain
VLGERLGRPVRAVTVASWLVEPVGASAFARLGTTGAVQLQRVVLRDPERGQTMAVQSAAVVFGQVLPDLLGEVLGTGASDRVLVGGRTWTAEVIGIERTLAGDLSVELSWAAADAPAVRVTRLIRRDSEPVAVMLDEIPYLPGIEMVGGAGRQELRVLFLRRLGARVTVLRTAAGLSRTELASRARVGRSFVNWTERGTALIRTSHLERIARALGILPRDLVPCDDEPGPSASVEPDVRYDTDPQLLLAPRQSCTARSVVGQPAGGAGSRLTVAPTAITPVLERPAGAGALAGSTER